MTTPRGAKHRDLEQRIKDLEDQVRALTSAQLRRRQLGVTEGDFVVSGGGSVVVQDRGAVRVNYPNGEAAVYAGDVYDVGSGAYQGTGLLVQNQDGSDVAALHTDTTDATAGQVRLYDKGGWMILNDDGVTGYGIAAPHFDVPVYEVTDAGGRVVNTTAWTVTHQAELECKQPYLDVSVEVRSAGTGGEVDVLIDGARVGAIQSFSSSTFLSWRIALHSRYELFSLHNLQIRCRRTSGTSTLTVRPYRVRGGQS